MLEKDVYKRKGGPFFTIKYRNIFITAMNIGERDWAEEFINKYRHEIIKETRDNTFNLLSAQLNFFKGMHEKALGFLSKVKDENFTAKYDTKELNLKIYYELGYFEAGFSLIGSMRHFLSKSKQMREARKTKIQNFVNIMNSLFKLKANYSEEGLSKVKATLENMNSGNINNYSYILKKVKILEENNKIPNSMT